MSINFAKVRREELRWTIMLTLDKARPIGTSETLILSVAQSLYEDATQMEIRRELDYLEARKLVEIRREPTGRWIAELTRYGIDVVEYTVDCDPGIARPKNYAEE